MRNQKVIDILHLRSFLREALSAAKLDFISRDGLPPTKQIICPEAPYADRIVTQESILDGIVLFELLIDQQDQKLSRFEIRERETGELVLPTSITKETENVTEETAPPGSTKLKRKPKGSKPESSSETDPVGGGSKAP